MPKKAFSKFGDQVAEAIAGYFPALAKNALKIGTLTENDVVNGTTKQDVGLGSVENNTIKKTYTVGDALLAGVYVVPLVVRGIVDNLVSKFQGVTGKILYMKTKTKMDVEADYPIHDIAVCTGATERDACLASKTIAVVYERNEHRLWTLSGGVYTEAAKASIINYIKPNRWYVNRQTKRLFYARTATQMVPF